MQVCSKVGGIHLSANDEVARSRMRKSWHGCPAWVLQSSKNKVYFESKADEMIHIFTSRQPSLSLSLHPVSE
jgi:hypothetical protein